eukprot:TRINITY_DN35754_c0_g1_i2.p1 TRINITY_DN35754_c0_g1~~TRINITY_DN35754_c0_g1_i2.p1  ORF type:complete len:285 (-),score=92.33 TRINITY_DN35754_c0_g1_i2:17-871(-)
MPPKAACKKCAPLFSESEAQRTATLAELEAEKKKGADVERSRQQDAAAASAKLADVERALSATRAERDEARGKVDALQQALDQSRTELASWQESASGKSADLAGELQDMRKQVAEAKQQLSERDAQLEDAKKQLVAATEERARQAELQKLRKAEGLPPQATQQPAAAEKKTQSDSLTMSTSEAEVAKLKDMLAVAEAEIQRLRLDAPQQKAKQDDFTERICVKRAIEGSLMVRVDVRDKNLVAEMQLARLKQESREIAERAERQARMRSTGLNLLGLTKLSDLR